MSRSKEKPDLCIKRRVKAHSTGQGSDTLVGFARHSDLSREGVKAVPAWSFT